MHSETPRRASWLLALFLPWLALASACSDGNTEGTAGGAPAAQSAPLPPDARGYRAPAGTPIVIISIDTLRSDRLPAYGFDEVATPAIDQLRRDGILYQHAYSHMGLTLPSHLSILTGRLPLEHGVRDNLGYRFDSTESPTLAERLGGAGYETAGFVSSYVLRAATGVDAGFEHWDDEIPWLHEQSMGSLQRDGASTLERATEWLAGRSDGDRPLLLFFHIYEPHSPYLPAEPWASRYADPYVAEVAEADALVGGLLDVLREQGLYDPAVVVLLSDHGEGLMDHGEAEHEILIYREVLQVPLIVKLPQGRFAGSSVGTPAQLVDVAPTLYALLGLEAPSGLTGGSLLEIDTAPDRHVFSESIYPRLHMGWSDLASIIRGRHHLIAGPDPELYDLIADPAERDDLYAAQASLAGELEALLGRYDRTIASPAEVDSETAAALEALGYLSGGPTASTADGAPLPDPKSRIHLLEELSRANRLHQQERYADEATVLERVLASEPGMVHAWEQLAKAQRAAGRPDEALAAYERALEVSGGAGNIQLSIAELQLDLGNLEAARLHADAALPNFEVAWDLLAQIDLREGDLDAARAHLDRALEGRGGHLGPLITETEWLVRKERFEEALAVAARAEAEFGGRRDREVLRGLYFQKASAFMQLDRLDEAERAYLDEIEISPHELAPYSFLAFLYALQDRRDEAADTLRGLLEANPTPEAHAQAVRTLRALGDPASADGLLATARERWPRHPALAQL